MNQFYFKTLYFALLLPNVVGAQDIFFHPKGSLARSFFVKDTILQTAFRPLQTGIQFHRIDAPELAQRSIFQPFLLPFLQKMQTDTVQYFYLFNGTTQNIMISEYNNLAVVEVAQTPKLRIRPVSVYVSASCVTDAPIISITIRPQEMLILKNKRPPLKGTFKTIGQLRLRTATNGILVSTPYSLRVDEFVFCADSKNEEGTRILMKLHSISFLE